MIPLRIADQAVAACEAEIQKLRKENARLRKAGDKMADWLDNQGNYGRITDDWHKAKEVQS